MRPGRAEPVIHQMPGPVAPSGSAAVGTPILMVLVIPGTVTSSRRRRQHALPLTGDVNPQGKVAAP
jgi:hypothetical protein